MKIGDLPQEVISQTIDALIQSNPSAPMSRGDWFEYIEVNYQINSVDVNGYTHYFLEPKD
jgi:uncharacterized protein involved in high-affinity Fe2+ transport